MNKTKTSYKSMKALVEAGIIEQKQLDEAVNFSEWNETLKPLGDSISEVSLNCKK